MKFAAIHQLTMAALTFVCVAGFSGCAALKYMPYNHMCPTPPAGIVGANLGQQCQNACCQSQLAMAAVQDTAATPHLASDSPVPPLVQEQLDTLTAKNTAIQDQMMMLDKNLESQRRDREKVLGMMNDLVSELSTVRKELDDQQDEISGVETRINRHRDQTDRNLASIERELNDLLSQNEK